MLRFTLEDAEKACDGLPNTAVEAWLAAANSKFDTLQIQTGDENEAAERATMFADALVCKEATVPAMALMFTDKEVSVKFSKNEDDEETVKMDMVGYSGGVIKDHWWWDDLAIDLEGVAFSAKKFPILENHDTDRKVAFTGKPLVNENGIVANPDSTVFLDNDLSKEFISNSKKGFPYQSSIYVQPTSIERIEKDVEVEVNGFKMKGPGTVFRKCEFKEMSVCVFGWDGNTNATAFNKDVFLGKDCVVDTKFSEQSLGGGQDSQNSSDINSKEEIVMDLTKFKEEHPDLYKEVFALGVTDGKSEAEKGFSADKEAMDTKFTEMGTRVAKFEKAEVIRAEKELQHTAASIFSQKLDSSDIPEHLHDKVRPHVSYTKHLTDGVLDVEKFSEAIDTEIQSWVDKGVSTSVMGSGFSKDSVPADTATELSKESDDLTDSLLSFV